MFHFDKMPFSHARESERSNGCYEYKLRQPIRYMSTKVNISSGNGLSPVRRQAITWTNVAFL